MATAAKPTTQGLSKNGKTIVISVAAGLSTYGTILQLQDADDIGPDDEIGHALVIASDVFRKVATGKITGKRDDVLRAIADGIYTEIGLTPLEE